MQGNIYPVQQTADGAITYVEGLPSKGHKAFIPIGDSEFTKHESLADNCFSYYVKRGISHIDTPFYSIRINNKGNFISLYDKENDRELVQPGKALNRLVVYEDKPMSYDNWDIDMYYTEKSYPVDDLVRLEWAESGCVRSTLRLAWNFNNSKIEQNVYFYKNNRRIDFDTHVDWKEHQHLLKVHFPVDVHTDEAVFEIQFGNIKRKTHTNTSWDEARFESCGQKWMDISEGNYGVSVLNDCKYGHSVRESDVGLTLVKSGIEPNPVTDQEDHYFIYSLYPHGGGWADGNTVREAYKLNQPVYAVNGMAETCESSFVAADKRNVMIETVKRSEDGKGIIVRLYEFENARTKTTLAFGCDISEAYECNLIEDVCSRVDTADNEISLVMKPYEIKTLKIIPR
jgi:alpha-mannosidase